ncbi:MAG TPA: YibE/F family protein [bacterium]|nr:YibE/F family protein [bacterium]HOL48001.1 YibE/F family protein [bacterium]HPQ18599.1 YibE/F family protein [bacterium]
MKTIIIFISFIIFINSFIFSLTIDGDIKSHPLLFFNKNTDFFVKVKLLNEPDVEEQKVKIKILQGQFKDNIIDAFLVINENKNLMLNLIKDDLALAKIVINEEEKKIVEAYIIDYYRVDRLFLILIMFIILLILFLRKKVLLSIIGIFLEILLLFVFLNYFIHNNNIFKIIFSLYLFVLLTMIIAIFFNTFNFKKSILAILCCFITLTIIFFISYYLIKALELKYFFDDYIQLIDYYSRNVSLIQMNNNYYLIIFAGILLSLTGILSDVAVSISSSMYEIANGKSFNLKEILKSGFNVGKDILSTEINTIVFALIGSNFGTFILFFYSNDTLKNILNKEIIAIIISEILICNIGIILVIFIGVLINAYYYSKKN